MVLVLQVNQPVGDVLGISDIIDRDLEIAARALQDAVDEIGHANSIVSSVLVEPLLGDRLRGLTGAKHLSCADITLAICPLPAFTMPSFAINHHSPNKPVPFSPASMRTLFFGLLGILE